MNNIIYVLRLQHLCYYIGKTTSLQRRTQEHFSGNGALWTKLHPPIELIESFNDRGFDELSTTLCYMKQYGINNVRGSEYVLPFLTKKQQKTIQLHFSSENNACFICYKIGHYTKNCPNKKPWYKRLCCYKKDNEENDYYTELYDNKSNIKNVLIFGKYKGKTYEEVYNKDKDYIEWIMEQEESTFVPFNQFQRWIKEKN